MADLEVTLAGAMTLRRGEQRVEDRSFGSGQFRLVTAMLVVDRADPLPLERLADELWGGRPPTRWRTAVRGLVSRLRSHLVDLGLERDVIVATGGSYHVHLDSVVVDVEQAVSVLATARDALAADSAAEAVTAAGTARSVLSRPVLSGLDTPWVEALRVRLAAAHLDSLVVLATARTALGGTLQARPALREAVELDPLREDAWRALMSVEVAMGNPARALAAYDQCRRHLAEELGVDPAAETQRMHRDILRAGIVPGDGGDVGVDDERPRSDRPPYVGLRTFTQDDADRFFGRDAEVQALVRRLVSHGIVAVVGPSGVGKSSLVRAGLLPALARGAIPDAERGPAWSWCLARDRSRRWRPSSPGSATTTRRPSTNRLRRPDGLRLAATRLLGDQPPSARLLLVVDQFEELFTLRGAGRAASFVALLQRATASLDRRVSVVVTLRSDFYSRAAAVPGVAELLSTSQFVVPPLAGEQVEEVVAGPARRTGVSLEPGLLGRIVTDVANEPGALPLLQHLLYELWERRVDHVLTRGAYEDLGGVAGALANGPKPLPRSRPRRTGDRATGAPARRPAGRGRRRHPPPGVGRRTRRIPGRRRPNRRGGRAAGGRPPADLEPRPGHRPAHRGARTRGADRCLAAPAGLGRPGPGPPAGASTAHGRVGGVGAPRPPRRLAADRTATGRGTRGAARRGRGRRRHPPVPDRTRPGHGLRGRPGARAGSRGGARLAGAASRTAVAASHAGTRRSGRRRGARGGRPVVVRAWRHPDGRSRSAGGRVRGGAGHRPATRDADRARSPHPRRRGRRRGPPRHRRGPPPGHRGRSARPVLDRRR